MSIIKKPLAVILAFTILTSCILFASAGYEGEARAVIGANLSDEQIDMVYSLFDIERGEVQELTVTNGEERSYLEGIVSESAIGTRSISCVYINMLAENEGLSLETTNINWCTDDIYTNALITAGITDAEVIIAAPFEVSGTAALTGIYKAYEDITGEVLDEDAKTAATEELVITSELADEIGSADAAEIVTELKKILDETSSMTDEELKEVIKEIAANIDVTVTNEQIQQLIELVRKLEKLDTAELISRVEKIQEGVKKATSGLSLSGLWDGIAGFFNSIIDFISGLFN